MAFGAVFPLDGKTETMDAMGVSPWSFTFLLGNFAQGFFV